MFGLKDLKKLEVHHIEEQNKADGNGFIGHVHKNIPGNLTDLCESCHEMIHKSGYQIVKQETSKGISLEIETKL